MALTPKEREKIIEEETLRYETRKNLCGNHGSKWRWLWRLVGILFLISLLGRVFCGHGACGYRGMNGYGHHCTMGQQDDAGVPGQPVAPAKK